MAVRWYIIGLVLSCTVGGLTVLGLIYFAGHKVELRQQAVSDSSMSVGELTRFEDTFAQWMLLGDLVIGSDQTYLAKGAQDLGGQLLEILNQIAGSPSIGFSNPLIVSIIRFIERQQDRLDRTVAIETGGDARQLSLDVLLREVDEEAGPALEALEALRIKMDEVLAADKRALTLADNRRNMWTIAAVGGFIVWVVGLWAGTTRIISRPLRRLRNEAITARAENRRLHVEHFGPSEVRDLSQSFGELVGRLEDAVAERTNHLARKNAELAEARDHAVLALDREKAITADLEEAMKKLEEFASTDKLTGLPNRAIFLDRLTQLMKQSRRDGERFAVLFFDFDRFKVVNDSLGHEIGDELLCDIAAIFRRELRESDSVARFGGDEFILLLGNLATWSDAQSIAKRFLEVFARPHQLGDHLIVSNASIGLVTNERAYEFPSDMIRDADAAMYQAKENGRAQIVVFDKKMHANALDRLSLEADLQIALSDEQFQLVYQPIVELNNGQVTGFEALIRWEHPERGVLSPLVFIPIAEDTGLIVQIGQWVLRTAAAQIVAWNQKREKGRMLKVNVNISKRQLLDPMFLDYIVACQRDYGLHSGELLLEVTESMIVDERTNVAPLLQQLRELGFPIAMDDFGTGVSSMSSLHELPIDVLKIDQAFIHVLDRDRSLLAVVASITNLADNLGIQTVAEGIETGDIVGALQSIGCTWGQGYYFAKPLPPSKVEAFLLQHSQKRYPHAA